MDSLDRTTQTNYPNPNERVFLYEVVIPSQPAKSNTGSLYRRSRMFFRVTYSQMNQIMQRIARLGGKIVSIKPLALGDQDNIDKSVPWWVEISTAQPKCIYYFGPFDSADEAQSYKPGYIEDIQAEGAIGIFVEIKQCYPQLLTQEG